MGTFRVYDENGKLLAKFGNHFVDSGKQATLDYMFNSFNWESGHTTFLGDRFMAIGSSTDTNAGVTGPADGAPVPVSGSWDGVSDSDWKLSNEITGTSRAQISCIRAGNTANIVAQISDSNVDHAGYGADIDIYEIGIFLSGACDTPTADPTDVGSTDEHKAGAMLVRGIYYQTEGTGYIVPPDKLTKSQGSDLYIHYTFSDFEG